MVEFKYYGVLAEFDLTTKDTQSTTLRYHKGKKCFYKFREIS